MSLHDVQLVRREYEDESGLLARRPAYASATGPEAPALVFEALREVLPERFLEAGCGPGELAARVQREHRATAVAIDLSERMVELARSRGVDARVGDAQKLPFGDAEFDCALFREVHVPELDDPRVVRRRPVIFVATK